MLPTSRPAARTHLAPHGPRRRGTRGRSGLAALLAGLAALAAGCSAAAAHPAAAHPAAAHPAAAHPAAAHPAAAHPAAAHPAAAHPAARTPPAVKAACKQLPAGDLPGSSGALTQDDSGVFCLAVGGRIDVFLTRNGASGSTRWSEITTSDARVLAPTNNGMLTAPMGVTPGLFHAVSAGQAQLLSRLPDGKTWQVTIETLPG